MKFSLFTLLVATILASDSSLLFARGAGGHAGRTPAVSSFDRRPASFNTYHPHDAVQRDQYAVRARMDSANFGTTATAPSSSATSKAEDVRNEFTAQNPDWHNIFNNKFYEDHHLSPYYPDYRHDWWGPYANWGTLSGWLGYGWDDPVYYSYPLDDDFTTTSDDDATSSYSNYVQPVPSQAINTAQTAQSQPELTNNSSVLPLGVFAVSTTPAQASSSSMVIQLAVDRQGDLSGTYYNQTTDNATGLIGRVDPQTQQAYWSLAGTTTAPMMMTGAYNLTQSIVPVKVYFADGSSQNWVLVRLNQPNS